jgi:hypothetical protein
MAREGIPTPPYLGAPKEGFDLRPERLPGRPLVSTPYDLESPRSHGRFPAAADGFASSARQPAALSFLPHSS